MDNFSEKWDVVRNLVDKELKADDYVLSAKQKDFSQIRFAANTPTQNLKTTEDGAVLTAHFEQKKATVKIPSLEPTSVRGAFDRVRELARLSEVDKEYCPSLGSEQSFRGEWRSSSEEQMSDEKRMAIANETIVKSTEANIECSGKVIRAEEKTAVTTKNGLESRYQEGHLLYEHTLQRGREATKVRDFKREVSDFDPNALWDRSLMELDSVSPRQEFSTGKYPVVISASATMQMLPFFILYAGSKREVDEQRSPLNGQMGKKVGKSFLNISADPLNPSCLARPFNDYGVSQSAHHLIKAGQIEELPCDQFWASKTGATPWGWLNIVMEGASKKDQELISQIDDGFYVTDVWYVRNVKLQDLTMTGMTRNALLKIEKGKIVGGSTHFRWNMSFYDLMDRIQELGRAELGWSMNRPSRCPSLLVDDFYFSSTSSA